MAPPVGFEPTTQRLTAACSATELQGTITSLEVYKFLDVNSRFNLFETGHHNPSLVA